jgi:hypothetical protein
MDKQMNKSKDKLRAEIATLLDQWLSKGKTIKVIKPQRRPTKYLIDSTL